MGNTLGDRLRALREQSGKTQRELAALLCINRVSYTQYENNKRTPPPDTLRKLAIIFNVSVDYLLGLEKKFFGKDYSYQVMMRRKI